MEDFGRADGLWRLWPFMKLLEIHEGGIGINNSIGIKEYLLRNFYKFHKSIEQ